MPNNRQHHLCAPLTKCLTFPEKAAFGRMLPKSTIYAHASPTARMKTCFVRDVEKILWSYKFAPETVNLPATGYVQEIQVLTVLLKNGTVNDELLQVIDRAIPSPLFFVLRFQKRVCYVAAHKRRSEADAHKWVLSGYFRSAWIAEDAEAMPLPMALDLDSLYRQLLTLLIPLGARDGEGIQDLIARAERARQLEREIERLETRLRREKQFNRKVELNAELREHRRSLDVLTA